MKVETLIPGANIAGYVQHILVIENVKVTTPFVLPLYANGTPTILFQTTRGQIKENTNNLTLFGQTVFPENLVLKDDFTLVAYFFKPFSLFSLFGVSAQDLTDSPIDLNLLQPSKTLLLQEQLLNAATIKEMLRLIDDYIVSLVNKVNSNIELIKYATGIIASNPAKEALQKVQKELYLTERTFQRMFEKNIGVSPNQYRRICQFNTAFLQLQKRKFRHLTDIAFENGYADQSHYIRSFKEFTNITPKDYLALGYLT
jgi:AraC-like DNA-binding protein